jgi:hypothetical protein
MRIVFLMQENEKEHEEDLAKIIKIVPGEVNNITGLANLKSIETIKAV